MDDTLMDLPRLEDLRVANKTVLVRVDLNVPMLGGQVTENTRIVRLLPTLNYLLKKKARVVVLSHFGRPGGKFVPSLSLAPLVDALSHALGGKPVAFGVDCIGPAAQEAVKKLKPGEILLLENLRFHAGEEKGERHFAADLASLGDLYVNDAFSCSHRAHASITGIPEHLPSAAGRLLQQEIGILNGILSNPKRPITAIVGGAKISTKLELLEKLIRKTDTLVIGGAMANTFLLAQGHSMGKSLVEPNLKATAKRILDKAKKAGCDILLPKDVVKTSGNITSSSSVADIAAGETVFDIGNETFRAIADCLGKSKTVIWNGPVGLFETRPFDVSTIMIAREIARLTDAGKIKSIAGGGDTVAAIAVSGLMQSFTYVSTAGGAFLEWLEGKTLPGVAALAKPKHKPKHKAAG